MEDVLLSADVYFSDLSDLKKLRQIAVLSNRLDHVCNNASRALDEAAVTGAELARIVLGDNLPRKHPSLEKRYRDIWYESSTGLTDSFDGSPLLKDGVFSLDEIELVYRFFITSDDRRIAGNHELRLHLVDAQHGKAILWGTHGEEDKDTERYPVYFAVMLDLRHESGQAVPVAVHETEPETLYFGDPDLIVTDQLLETIRPPADDSGRVDA